MQGAPPLVSPGLNPRGAGSTCWGFLSGRFYKCRRRSNAGVPGAKPPAKLTFNLPLPAGKGGGGMGAVKKAKGWAGRRQRRHAPLRLPEGQGRRAANKASPRRGTPLPPFVNNSEFSRETLTSRDGRWYNIHSMPCGICPGKEGSTNEKSKDSASYRLPCTDCNTSGDSGTLLRRMRQGAGKGRYDRDRKGNQQPQNHRL